MYAGRAPEVLSAPGIGVLEHTSSFGSEEEEALNSVHSRSGGEGRNSLRMPRR
jgi:hypothetical protein